MIYIIVYNSICYGFNIMKPVYKDIQHILYDIHLISRDDRRLPSIY
jgi:hypothetical protein